MPPAPPKQGTTFSGPHLEPSPLKSCNGLRQGIVEQSSKNVT